MFQCNSCACKDAPVEVTEPIPSLSEHSPEIGGAQVDENNQVEGPAPATIEEQHVSENAIIEKGPACPNPVEAEGVPSKEVEDLPVAKVQAPVNVIESGEVIMEVKSRDLPSDPIKLEEMAMAPADFNVTSPAHQTKDQATTPSAEDPPVHHHYSDEVLVEKDPPVKPHSSDVVPVASEGAAGQQPMGFGWKVNNKLAQIEARFVQLLMTEPGTGSPQNFEKKFGWKVNDALDRATVRTDKFFKRLRGRG